MVRILRFARLSETGWRYCGDGTYIFRIGNPWSGIPGLVCKSKPGSSI
jgi:hypothetical protein